MSFNSTLLHLTGYSAGFYGFLGRFRVSVLRAIILRANEKKRCIVLYSPIPIRAIRFLHDIHAVFPESSTPYRIRGKSIDERYSSRLHTKVAES